MLRYDGTDGLDFRLIWLAGKMWTTGADPYSSEFITLYRGIFGEGPASHFWVYPPNWYPVAAPLGLMSFESALLLWKIAGFCLLLGSALILGTLFEREGPWRIRQLTLSILTVSCVMQATSVAISLGQTSVLLYFGICSVLYGIWLKPSQATYSATLIAGVFITLLKPNIGLTFAAALLALGHWRSVAAAVAMGVASAVPVFIATGWLKAIQGFAENLSRYNAVGLSANAPPDMTGVTHLVDLVSRANTPALGWAIASAALAVAICIGVNGRRNKNLHPDDALYRVAFCSIFALLLVPLHSYDLIPLAGVGVLLIVRLRHQARWLIAVGLLLALRAGNLAKLTGIRHPRTTVFDGSLLESIALTAIAIACVWVIASTLRTARTAEFSR